jgi:hypothetical protein
MRGPQSTLYYWTVFSTYKDVSAPCASAASGLCSGIRLRLGTRLRFAVVMVYAELLLV